MAAEFADVNKSQTPAPGAAPEGEHQEPGEMKLLLEAFQIFTNASSSLESAYLRLQAHARQLTEELAAKNQELERSLREKHEAQEYLTTVLERLPCGVLVLDQKGRPALCNPMALELLGQSRPKSGEKKKRIRLPADVRRRLASSVSPKAPATEVEMPIVCRKAQRTLSTSGTPLADEFGNRTGTLHIIRDITEMKSLQEQGKRVERLSAMGEMAVELAHEIRNPLGSIELFASLLASDLSGDSKRWAENIRVGIRSLNTIVSNMLHFANPIPPSFSRISLHEVLRGILKFTEAIMQQRQVRVETRLHAVNPEITGDPELLKQMMLNLIFNAMKAMPSRGSLTIATRTVRGDAGGESPDGLELQVQDTGIGIPPENLSRIFDPFFTTNKNGTGLGLSVVHQIVAKHSGTIRVTSEVNRGTTFTIVFSDRPEKG